MDSPELHPSTTTPPAAQPPGFETIEPGGCAPPVLAALETEARGSLSVEEHRLGQAEIAEPSEIELDGAISRVLLTQVMEPDVYLCAFSERLGGPRDSERENAYVNLRTALGLAMQIPTDTQLAAVGRAAVACARLAMREVALTELTTADESCHSCGAEHAPGGTCSSCSAQYAAEHRRELEREFLRREEG